MIEFIFKNWGNLSSLIGLIICVLTLMKVSSIAAARKEERKLIKEVLFLIDLNIFLEETKTTLKLVQAELSKNPDNRRNDLKEIVENRLNNLYHLTGEFTRAITSIELILENKRSIIYPSNFEKAYDLFKKEAYSESIKYFRKEIELQQLLTLPRSNVQIARSFANIALANQKLNNRRSALESIQISLEFAKKSKDSRMIEELTELLNNMSDKKK